MDYEIKKALQAEAVEGLLSSENGFRRFTTARAVSAPSRLDVDWPAVRLGHLIRPARGSRRVKARRRRPRGGFALTCRDFRAAFGVSS
jgi:hypothetical protein